MQSNKYVRWVISTDLDGYNVEPTWRDQQCGRGVVCPKCEQLSQAHVDEVGEIVVRENGPVGGDFSNISKLGGPHVVSTRAIEVLTKQRLFRVGRLIPIIGATGKAIDGHMALVGVAGPIAVRGSAPQHPCICGVCGDLKYWPGWPPADKWYLLRRYWPSAAEMMLTNRFLLYSDGLWRSIVEAHRLRGVKAHKVTFSDEPADGLPADYGEMITEIRRRAWVT